MNIQTSLQICMVILASIGITLTKPAKAGDIAIVGAKVFTSPFATPIDNGTVVIHDDLITAVGPTEKIRPPANAAIIDGRGRVVTAGYWNSHVHLFNQELLHVQHRSNTELSGTLGEMFNRWGFTTVFDVGSLLENTQLIRTKIRQGAAQGPNILTVGEPFYPPAGIPIYVRQFLKEERIDLPQVTTMREALAREKHEIDNGADGVKLFTGSIVGGDVGVQPMSLLLARALVNQAHHYGKPVLAHPSNAAGVEIAIQSGVDVLAHTAPMMGRWNANLVQQMLSHRMALIPTLTLFEIEAKRFGESDKDKANSITTAQQQLRAYWTGGGDILFGTDIGYTDADDTTEEYRLMSSAGLDYRTILASLTTTPARRFGYATRKGQIAVGMDADLVILGHDPAVDPTAFSNVVETIRGGQTIFIAKDQAH